MKITVKLFASFRTGRFVIQERDYPEGTTVGQVAEDLNLPEQELGIMLVNTKSVLASLVFRMMQPNDAGRPSKPAHSLMPRLLMGNACMPFTTRPT